MEIGTKRLENAALNGEQYQRALMYVKYVSPPDRSGGEQCLVRGWQAAIDWQKENCRWVEEAAGYTVSRIPLIGQLSLTVTRTDVRLGISHEERNGDWLPVEPGPQHLAIARAILGDEAFANAQFGELGEEYWSTIPLGFPDEPASPYAANLA